jgi:hypothetical protein
MTRPRRTRGYVFGQLLLMVAAYYTISHLSEARAVARSSLDGVALVLSYLAVVVMGFVTLRAVYVLRGLELRRPCAPAELRGSFDMIRGIVVARADTFDGPDGRPCVAALRSDYALAGQNRWIPFSLAVDGEEFRVEPTEPEAVITVASARTWKHVAVRPRSFERGAWAPELVDEARHDWVCLRPGDFVELRGSLHWGVAPLSADESRGVTAAVDEPSATSPYRTAHAPVIDLRRRVGQSPDSTHTFEYYALTIEVMHPQHDLAWRKREVVRKATLVCQLAAGIAVLSWISFAFEQLGLLAPMPWLLFTLAVVLLMPVYGAYVASTLPIARTDPTPPPWQREVDA